MYLNFPIGEGPKSSWTFTLDDTGARLNDLNIDYHQSVSEHHPNLVLKFPYTKDLYDVDPFNISELDEKK